MRYDVETKSVELTVAELCLFATGLQKRILTCEDAAAIDSFALSDESYQKNQSVVKSFSLAGKTFKMRGEFDGYCEKKDGVRIDVLKIASPKEIQKKPKEELLTYAKCCAWLVCQRDALDFAFVRVIRKDAENGGFDIYEKKCYFAELDILVKTMISMILARVNQAIKHETIVRPSAAALRFPYEEVREGQDEMMRGVAQAIRKRRRMFAQAPTGIGKTISALYPAVRAFGRGECNKIFYLTAKTDTSREAYAAASRLYKAGASLRTIVISSKDQMCCSGRAKIGGCRDSRYCNERDCIFKKRYSDKVGAAIEELLSKQNGYYSSVISEVAIKHEVCPYDLSLDLSELCDIIICDYNYLFDPYVRIKRYFDHPGDFGEYVFLIDEAHNLVDRARAIYSSTVTQNELLEARELVEVVAPELLAPLDKAIETVASAKELCRDNMRTEGDGSETGYYISRNRPEFITEGLKDLGERLEKWLKYNKDSGIYEQVNELFASVRKFMGILNFYDDKFMTYVETSRGNVSVSFNCIDPSDILDGILGIGRSGIMFSATLAPLSYFCDLLGGGRKPICIDLASPYDPERLCIAAVDSVSTRFEDRDRSYKKIATCIAAAVSPKAGNYIVYFPSYGYLEKVHEAFVKKYPKVKTIVQKKGMSRFQHEEFIASFKDDENKMRIGFCVLGGSFSEGVDLPGNRLIGSIVVGVGLPGFSSERNIMRDYFENRYENGFAYAYTYPGMNNVLQAAGRVIRREEDKGIVVLIDDRYGEPTYRQLFPKHWSHLLYAGDASSLAEITKRFWEKQERNARFLQDLT